MARRGVGPERSGGSVASRDGGGLCAAKEQESAGSGLIVTPRPDQPVTGFRPRRKVGHRFRTGRKEGYSFGDARHFAWLRSPRYRRCERPIGNAKIADNFL